MNTGPTCWKCGYALSGLQVDDLCPECGTPVWSQKPAEKSYEGAQKAQLWGLLALVLFFACLGPLASILAVVALRYAKEAEAEVRYAASGQRAPSGIRTGRICAWITIGLSIAIVAFYAVGLLLVGVF